MIVLERIHDRRVVQYFPQLLAQVVFAPESFTTMFGQQKWQPKAYFIWPCHVQVRPAQLHDYFMSAHIPPSAPRCIARLHDLIERAVLRRQVMACAGWPVPLHHLLLDYDHEHVDALHITISSTWFP